METLMGGSTSTHANGLKHLKIEGWPHSWSPIIIGRCQVAMATGKWAQETEVLDTNFGKTNLPDCWQGPRNRPTRSPQVTPSYTPCQSFDLGKPQNAVPYTFSVSTPG